MANLDNLNAHRIVEYLVDNAVVANTNSIGPFTA